MSITALNVSEDNRLSFLPKHFGVLAGMAENHTYNVLENMCSEYNGGYWEFYELSNGGFYMAPCFDENLHLTCWGNHFDDTVSADAAGIIVTLFTLNALCFKTQSERFLDAYELLREFADSHKEANKIFAAID